MHAITQPAVREIVDDFAEAIRIRLERTAKPSKIVINFRNDRKDNVERDVVKVPIGLLRFRKNNGRISSDLLDYENTNGFLDERTKETQKLLGSFLERQDPEQNEILKKLILHDGQTDPAIITCDGFLINGNRRKMVMERLPPDYSDPEKFTSMRVVILPGEKDEGGPPTLLEIEKLENRYQLQSEGKAEYYGFNTALSIRRKMKIGLSLRDQINDDPQYAGSTPAQVEKAIKDIEKNYLMPLDCVDRYLMLRPTVFPPFHPDLFEVR